MKCGRIFLITTALAGFVGFTATAQNTQDCREKKDVPLFTGHWRDDQTGRELDIAYSKGGQYQSLDPTSKTDLSVIATYSQPHNCPHPGADGNQVPLPVDFDGTVWGTKFVGVIHVCKWREQNGRKFTYGTSTTDLKLWMDADGMKMHGYWPNGDTKQDEEMTLTRLDKPEFPMSKYTRVEAAPGAKIYAKPDTTSQVRYMPAAGTKLEIWSIDTDDKGNVTWYLVTDPTRSVGSNNYGWIKLGQVKCIKAASNKPN